VSRITKPVDSRAALSPSVGHIGRKKWLYPVLFAIQTVGAVLLCGQVLPIYRRVLANPTAHESDATLLALGAGVLIQLGYWICYRIRPVLPRFFNVALGHTVLFLAKLIFILPSAIFSFLFIAKTLEAEMPVSRYLVILFGLFSLFCYVRELERLGNHLLSRPKE
jgi:ABC-type nickel/cobalt efflux system permease component RcnA